MKSIHLFLISLVLISSLIEAAKTRKSNRTDKKSTLSHFPVNKEVAIYTTMLDLVFDINEESLFDGAQLIIYPFNGKKNQRFVIEESPVNGYYYIRCVNSGKYLDVSERSLYDGAEITQYEKQNRNFDNQIFKIEPVRDGFFSIIAKHSGKALDVDENNFEPGNRIVQYEFLGGENQVFKFLTL